jgi:hypothetical protein
MIGWHTYRVFPIGIGYSASQTVIISFVRMIHNNCFQLVNGMARVGKGVAEYVYPGEKIEEKVVIFIQISSNNLSHRY